MTSPPEQISSVECPECGHIFEDWYRPSINADLDPEMATDAEYMRQATTATCPSCGQVAELGVLATARSAC